MQIKDKFLKDALLKCGWQENRSINVKNYQAWYHQFGILPSDIIYDFLKNFGGLTLKIPCCRYQNRVISNQDSDFTTSFVIDPTFYVTDDFTQEDRMESYEYLKDIASFLNIKELFPIGYSDKSEELLMSTIGEVVLAYEGDCICLGRNFEEAFIRIITDENTEMQSIW
ncbi:MAG: SUKH-3 domain-containing protein [Oscillospiraceae bacterium]|nr:SUKH-3 domain-containing protein [Oscillospiraceae bacterium]